MRALQSLMEQLGKDPNELQYLGKSPIHKKVVELRLAKPSPSKISSGSTKHTHLMPYSCYYLNGVMSACHAYCSVVYHAIEITNT